MDYKLIGEGSYGCVFKPSIPCNNYVGSYKKKISKLMLTKDSLKEVEEYTMIANADKKGEYYTGNPLRCTIKETPDVERAMKKCKIIQKKLKNKTMKQVIDESSLLIIGDGGDDLEKWVRKIIKNKTIDRQQITDFWIEIKRLFRGLIIFKTYKLVHHDLKPQNIVFNREIKRANFIDFGLMRSIKSEAAKCREVNSCKGLPHWNYPTETIFMNKKEFTILSKQTVIERQRTFEQYRDAIKKRTNINFVNAYNIMISYIFKRGDTERMQIFSDKYIMAWKELLLSIQLDKYDYFLIKTIEGFDLFGFGLSLMYVLSRLKPFMKIEIVKKLDDLFFKMMTPNIFVRITIEEALVEYTNIVEDI